MGKTTIKTLVSMNEFDTSVTPHKMTVTEKEVEQEIPTFTANDVTPSPLFPLSAIGDATILIGRNREQIPTYANNLESYNSYFKVLTDYSKGRFQYVVSKQLMPLDWVGDGTARETRRKKVEKSRVFRASTPLLFDCFRGNTQSSYLPPGCPVELTLNLLSEHHFLTTTGPKGVRYRFEPLESHLNVQAIQLSERATEAFNSALIRQPAQYTYLSRETSYRILTAGSSKVRLQLEQPGSLLGESLDFTFLPLSAFLGSYSEDQFSFMHAELADFQVTTPYIAYMNVQYVVRMCVPTLLVQPADRPGTRCGRTAVACRNKSQRRLLSAVHQPLFKTAQHRAPRAVGRLRLVQEQGISRVRQLDAQRRPSTGNRTDGRVDARVALRRASRRRRRTDLLYRPPTRLPRGLCTELHLPEVMRNDRLLIVCCTSRYPSGSSRYHTWPTYRGNLTKFCN